MVTIYKKKNSTVPAVLTAYVYDGAVEIHSTHRLASCISYKWFYDDLMGGGAVEISGATSKTYTVDLTQVSNSGEFYCEVEIGATGCSDQTTERKRVSIIECLFQTERVFNATNATAQVAVNAPHYESPIFNNEGNSWITANGNVTNSCTNNVCTFTQNLVLTDQLASANSARKGQVTLTTGTHICFFNIGQDYIRDVAGDGELPDAPNGPIISLSQPMTVLVGTEAKVVPSVNYVPPQSDLSNLQVTWTADDNIAFGTYDILGVRLTRSVAKTVKVTGTVTDSVTGLSASASVDVVFADPQSIPTVFTGGTYDTQGNGPTLTWLNTLPTYFNPNSVNAKRATTFGVGVGGGGNWTFTIEVWPWGLNAIEPTHDRDVIVSFLKTGYNYGETVGPDPAWEALDGEDVFIVPAGSGGAPASKTFEFSGIGDFSTWITLNNTQDTFNGITYNQGGAGSTELHDDMDIFVQIKIATNDN